MRTIRDLEISGKRVLVRVDFNVPMDEAGTITDDLRIVTVLPTIDYALAQGARVILCSHMGRPKGQRVEKYSLAPVAAYLSSYYEKEVPLAPDCVGQETEAMVKAMQDGDILLLENLRFHAEEQENDPEFARQLAGLADVYINNAFAVSHRAHASVVGVPKYVARKGAGFLLEKELDYFHRSVDDPVRPLVAIVGGAKVSSKLGALSNMLAKVDAMLIGGAMANTFLKSQGLAIGASKVEDDLLGEADDLIRKAGEGGVKIYLPVDVIAAESFSADAASKRVTIQDIPKGWMALDIGPASVICFAEVLSDARTIIWNGPMGAFEMDAFAQGTRGVARAVASAHALSITGGGDSNAAVKKFGEADNISYMSTGGGAFLMLMEGKELPGVVALED
jgi:phosphoglycerate kinase